MGGWVGGWVGGCGGVWVWVCVCGVGEWGVCENIKNVG